MSYEKAKELFSKVSVKIFPDIVTTLIGLRQYDNPRSGVCLCTRNDDENFIAMKIWIHFVTKLG